MNEAAQLDRPSREYWGTLARPGFELNQEAFRAFLNAGGSRLNVLNCSTVRERAEQLVSFQYPPGWNFPKCMQGSAGILEPGLENWDYEPIIRPQEHLPYFKLLPAPYANLTKSPWTHYPCESGGPALNTRLLRYHHALWQELQPKTLRGVFTTLVYVSPQIGPTLTPHILQDRSFLYLAALSRAGGPCQMMPSAYLYPDARLQGLENVPAAMFADILPHVGGDAFPVMECTPNPWGELARYDIRNYYYGYPFSAVNNSQQDVTLKNYIQGGIILPNGQSVRASESESFLYATKDEELRQDLMLNRDAFLRKHALVRGTITHDGLPFQIPPEMQACIWAIVVTGWELEMKRPGILSEYRLSTQHAAIRSYKFYQQVAPDYANFMRLIHEMAKTPYFETYLVTNHLTNSWLGGNLIVPNQHTQFERQYGAQFIRSYYRQQLDWLMGITNLWNHVSFSRAENPEERLPFPGVVFHQMRNLHSCTSHLFFRPIKKHSRWPDLHAGWLAYDQNLKVQNLPMPAFEN